MKLLIVSATAAEIGPFTAYLQNNPQPQADVLITGVGMVATTYMLTKTLLSNTYDLVLQAGVAGSYDRSLPLGSLVFITSDQFADLGAEDHDNYLDLFEMGLADKQQHPYTDGRLVTPILPIHQKIILPHATGLTINTVSGSERTIQLRQDKYGAAIESMEGAALHFVCLQQQVPFAQVRAISNYVIPRDKSQWQMKDAIINLNNWLIDFIKAL